jgi:hypothetical protein
VSSLIDLKETDAYAEFRAVPGNIDEVFARIYSEFKAAKYSSDCEPKSAPLEGACFFWESENDNIGVVVYTEQEVKDFGLVVPDGPVPSGSNLVVFYYWP